jgi:hypothetical protein
MSVLPESRRYKQGNHEEERQVKDEFERILKPVFRMGHFNLLTTNNPNTQATQFQRVRSAPNFDFETVKVLHRRRFWWQMGNNCFQNVP